MFVLTIENFVTQRLDYYSFDNGVLDKLQKDREQDVIHLLNRRPCKDPDTSHGVSVHRYLTGWSFKILLDQKAPDGGRGRVIFGYSTLRSVGITVDAVKKLLEVTGLTVQSENIRCLAEEVSKARHGFFIFWIALSIIAAMVAAAVCCR